ncbi:cell division protein FtsH [Candidatus Peregrinibacteria bacterium CG_4_10_14_0_2_um_filter_38_24]|nr:MAG: cell division protein FtsH [Candidatus Peregrinibacteria bacterium CG_4_10_14_0_2_um_filter_38_24]PJC38675.1 MAG: cell division protein FtsH [Candidatus Peregrinibacteria bacterium CG_4_9_14_0_2_um_filter_38_9]
MPNISSPHKPRNTILYVVVAALLISAGLMIFDTKATNEKEINLNTFIEEAKSGIISKITVSKNKINLELVDGAKQFTNKEAGTNLYELLGQTGVSNEIISKLPIYIEDTESSSFWSDILISIIPFILIVAFFGFMMRSAQSSNNQAMSFGKSKAKLFDKEKQKTTFEDVAGAQEAKEELVEIVDFLKHPQKYRAMGAKIPKGVMLIGSPGTGKTLLARAVAGEADVPFFNISGSEFVEMFVGVGASRVRDLFTKAKRNAPCIIFIDEIDAVGRHRGAGMGGGHDEREQTLNQILTEMDGFETGTNVIVIAATNRPDILDPALLRPGRFDRRVVVDMPDIKAREQILEVHGRNKPMAKGVDLKKIAKSTPGFTGADLENLMNEAAILATKLGKKTVAMPELEQSIEKVLMGPERKSRVLNKKEKEITAYHETGHAVVGHLVPNCDPVHKISIVSRGMALGVTWFLPDEDQHLITKSKFEDELCSLLGGYTSEEIFFGEMTTGASNDLQRATKLARNMVTKYGMSELGPIIFGGENDEIFIGKDYGHIKNYSEESSSKIDELTKKIIDKAYKRTKDLIEKHKDLIDRIAKDLLEEETIAADKFKKYFKE